MKEQVMPTTPKVTTLIVKPKAKMGRPTKLTPEVIVAAWEYLRVTGDISAFQLLPTIEGLAEELDVTRETLYDWEKVSDDFSDIVKRLRQKQAQKLIQNSLVNKYNPMISKLLLSKHGYVEKTEQDNTIKVVTPIMKLDTKDVIDLDD